MKFNIQSNTGKSWHICRFVVKNEGVDIFNRWYDEKHFEYVLREFHCTEALRVQCTKDERPYFVNNCPDDVTVFFAIYIWDSVSEMEEAFKKCDFDGLLEECDEIYPYVVEQSNEDGEELVYYHK